MTTSETQSKTEAGLPWIHRRPRLHRNINRAVGITLVLFLLGQIFIRTTDILPLGISLVRFVTYGMIVYVTIMALLWLTLCSRFSRRTVWTVTSLVLVAIAGSAAMIRSWSWTGDSWLAFEWRWQKTADERLEEYQKSNANSSAGATATITPITPEDMPAYRGIHRDGVVIGPPVREDWSTAPPKVLWKHEVGGGFAQPVVVGNSLVTIEQRRDNEVVVLYDATTGLEIWTYSTPGLFDAMGGPGPRATPVIHDGRVYALGALGHLACLDLATGKKVWSRELLGDLGVSNQTWGITSSPLVHQDWLIVNVGGYYGGGLVALKLADGSEVWKSEGIDAKEGAPPKAAVVELEKAKEIPPSGEGEHAPVQSGSSRSLAGYAAPIVVTLAGVPQILNFDGIGLWGHSIEDGRILWFHYFSNDPAVNVAQPILLPDDRVLISASYGVGSRLLKISKTGDSWSVEKLWSDLKSLESKMSSPALIDGYVYGFDEGFFACVDPETGKAKWKGSREAKSRGRYGHGQLLVTNGLIIVLSEYGDLVLIRPQPDKLVELGTFHVLDGEKTWNPPALVNGKMYIRNHHEMACVDVAGEAEPQRTAEAGP